MAQKYINYLMILFAFIFPISLGGANAVLGLILLLWIIEGNFKQKFKIVKQERIIWVFFAIGILTILSALFSESMSHSFLAGEKKSLIRVIISHYIAIPLILTIFITSIKPKYIDHIISAFLLAILMNEIVSYLIFFQVVDVSALQAKHLINKFASHFSPSPFMFPNEYSVFLSIASILLLHKTLHTKNRYFQFFIFLFLVSTTIIIFINGGRIGQISYIFAISTYMFFYYRFNIKIILSTVTVLTTIVLLTYNFSPNFHTRVNTTWIDIQQVSQGNYRNSGGIRIASTKVTLDYLTASPKNFILGAGAGDSRQVYLDHAKENFGKNISEPIKSLAHLHNQYLEYWMDGTIFSLILFLLFFFFLIKLNTSTTVKPLLYAIIVIMLFASATEIPFFRYKTAMLFMFISAYFILLSKKSYLTMDDK